MATINERIGPGAGKPPRRDDDPSDKRPRGEPVVRAVLEATLDEVARVGFAALSIEHVAERAGVNKTTIYRRFPTKTDLIAAALQSRKAGLFDAPDHGNLRDDVIWMLTRVGEHLADPLGKAIFRTLLAERSNPEASALAERMRRDSEREPLLVLQRGIARGELPPETDLRFLLHALFGPLMLRALLEGLPFEPADATALADLVLFGAQGPHRGARGPRARSRRARRGRRG